MNKKEQELRLRDKNIYELYKKGIRKSKIARMFKLSRERVGQIIERVENENNERTCR